ncbi:MAG TPA: sigma 54-interacting transcriptional regulator [Polyangiaceae bacterium]|nr:sigma 54-interacting transcriptional regulator [Polyangiaceae bacterium]
MSRDAPFFHSTDPNAPASRASSPGLVLSVVHPAELANTRLLLAPGLVLGRAPEAEVTSIFHATISRRHAAVQLGLGGVPYLADLESRNGTRVNGKSVERPVPLTVQSVVRLGDVLGVVDVPGAGGFEDDPVLPGTSAAIADLRALLARAASDQAPVLILGETGTGKERLARAVHERSGRRGAYVALNVAELSAQLIEGELFGHERGAFTGANAARTGLFQAAHGGTLFLDEIGELPFDLQAKLLRVLQEGEVRPLGATRPVAVDVRVVAATNRNLAELVEQGRFRRDLLARISFWEFRLPPLRERRQEILPWLALLLRIWNLERGAGARVVLLPDAAERVLLHDWRDNLRGLGRLVHRLASLESDRDLGVSALGAALPELGRPSDAPSEAPPAPQHPTSAPPRERPSCEEFLQVYESTGRSVRAAAKHFGKDRRQIYRWLESFGIPREPSDEG